MSKDRGWDYLNSSGEDFDYDKDNDGSWGYENDDADAIQAQANLEKTVEQMRQFKQGKKDRIIKR